MAHYRVVQKNKIGQEWIQNEKGRFVGSMSEDDEGRVLDSGFPVVIRISRFGLLVS